MQLRTSAVPLICLLGFLSLLFCSFVVGQDDRTLGAPYNPNLLSLEKSSA